MPQADADDCAERKQHTECDAQPPNSLDLVAVGLVNRYKGKVIYSLGEDTAVGDTRAAGDEYLGARGNGGCTGNRKCFAGELGQGLPDDGSYYDSGNEQHEIANTSNKQGQQAIIVENVCDGDVEGCRTCLLKTMS